MMEKIAEVTCLEEPARQTPIVGSFDVAVAGGGIAGVAAAVAAARNGASVCLIEKTCSLGGLATLGNVIVWLPICDGKGRQVIGGLAEELLKLSVADLKADLPGARFRDIPECWKPGGDANERKRFRYRTEFNPASYMLALEKLVLDSGIRIMYDTRLCAASVDNGKISHLIIENKSGRGALTCRTAVDASGDADLCYMAGEDTESLDSNVLCGWYYYLYNGELRVRGMSNRYSPVAEKDGAQGPFFRGDEADNVTEFIVQSRRMTRKKLDELRAKNPDADLQPIRLPEIPSFRMTRRLIGEYSLGGDDVHRWFDDAIGLTGDWRQPGPVYAVPMRSILGAKTRNLLAAGRCMSADRTAWDLTRAIPGCAMTGEAAGTAAAMSTGECDGDIHALPVYRLQAQLIAQGGLINPELVKPAE